MSSVTSKSPVAKDEHLALRVLELIERHDGPVGASVLQTTLAKEGTRLGEATVGRMLRTFDLGGLTLKHGRQGRSLTARGRARLAGLRRDLTRREGGNELLSVLDTESPLDLLDLLVGRRAIERETAHLATLHANDTDIAALKRIQVMHERSKHEGDSAVAENRDFHFAIARIARNRVLSTALELLLNEFAVSEQVVEVRKVAGAQFGVEHPRIIDAIETRNADKAAESMVDHINQIIRDLFRTYEHVFQRAQRELSDYL